jgi:hypothetical protein
MNYAPKNYAFLMQNSCMDFEPFTLLLQVLEEPLD